MRLIVHIGWPKTGTTTFQKHLFSRSEILHFDKFIYGDEISKIINMEKEEFERHVDSIASKLLCAMNENASQENVVAVFSDESFTNMLRLTRDKFDVVDFGRVVDNLCTLVALISKEHDVLIYMVKRNLLSFLQSYYAQLYLSLRHHGVKSPTEFFDLIKAHNLYKNDTMTTLLTSTFENVIIDSYERIFIENDISIISGLTGIDETVFESVLKNVENKKRSNAGYVVSNTYINRYNMNKYVRDQVITRLPISFFNLMKNILKHEVRIPDFDDDLILKIEEYASNNSGRNNVDIIDASAR